MVLLESRNKHFHNLLYLFLLNRNLKPLVANNLTGIMIAITFSLIPSWFYFSGLFSLGTSGWFLLFLLLALCFSSVYAALVNRIVFGKILNPRGWVGRF